MSCNVQKIFEDLAQLVKKTVTNAQRKIVTKSYQIQAKSSNSSSHDLCLTITVIFAYESILIQTADVKCRNCCPSCKIVWMAACWIGCFNCINSISSNRNYYLRWWAKIMTGNGIQLKHEEKFGFEFSPENISYGFQSQMFLEGHVSRCFFFPTELPYTNPSQKGFKSCQNKRSV